MKIVGLHPIEAPEPCHLIVIDLESNDIPDWGTITQAVANEPQNNWQVPYEEEPISDKPGHWAFFFHYLDLNQPLLTPSGPLDLPRTTSLPGNLESKKYEEP
jgi:hypothetical protein